MVMRLWLICAAAYFVSYLTRSNFAAVTVEIIAETGWEKSAISAVTTALFISYGIGQVISGWLGDHTRPEMLMAGGLIASAVMNLTIPFCTSISQMTVVWAVNGLAQAMMWPPISRILAEYCTPADYRKGTMIVSLGSSIATMSIFLLASMCAAWFNWRTLFYIAASTALVMVAVWLVGFKSVERFALSDKNIASSDMSEASKEVPKAAEEKKVFEKVPGSLVAIMCVLLISSLCYGALQNSISTWMPNYISESFSISGSMAILSSIIIPIFTTITYPVVLWYYQRFFKNEVVCAGTMFGMAAVATALIFIFQNILPVVAVLMLAVVSAAMYGVNFLIALVPKKFDRYGKVSTVSGLINAVVYVGSAASVWGIALIAENFGWGVTILVWGGLCIVGGLVCAATARRFGKHFE